jgi:hypothetical protein
MFVFRIVTKVTTDHFVATLTLVHTTVTTTLLSDDIVVYVIPLLALMTSSRNAA